MESDAIRRSATGPGVEDLPSASAPVPPGLRPVFEELFTWQNNMSSWAHDADEQEKLLSRLTDKVSGVNIDGSGDAGPSGYRETSSDAGSERAPSGHHEPVVTLAGISLMQRLLRTRLVRKSHDVEVQRKDSKSPLYSFKTFEDLSLRPELLKGMYACGFNEPSKIKETALPLLLADPPLNMIAQSQSGTGKTAAFVLASLSRVDEKQRYPQVRRILRTRLVPTSHDVEFQRKDPKPPLHSITTFEDLSLRPELLKSVYACGFNEPSKIKETALPLLLADPPLNMIAQSQSGTGKTAAFVLASLSRVDEKQRYPQVLILSPTYELAVQTGEVVKRMATFCTITFCYAVLGVTLSRGEKIQDPAILGTPGKIVDWAFKFNCFDLSRIKVFVLDEADIMIAMHGHH